MQRKITIDIFELTFYAVVKYKRSGGQKTMLNWIQRLLEAKALKEQHRVTQLKWKKAAMQRKIDLAKKSKQNQGLL